jgi:hypothetical protein
MRTSCVDRNSSVSIATRYGLGGPGIESRWGARLPAPSRPVLGLSQPSIQWVLGLSRGWSGRGVALTTHPHIAPRLKKEYNYTFPLGLRGLFWGEFYLLTVHLALFVIRLPE